VVTKKREQSCHSCRVCVVYVWPVGAECGFFASLFNSPERNSNLRQLLVFFFTAAFGSLNFGIIFIQQFLKHISSRTAINDYVTVKTLYTAVHVDSYYPYGDCSGCTKQTALVPRPLLSVAAYIRIDCMLRISNKKYQISL